MRKINSHKLRKSFLDYFINLNHHLVFDQGLLPTNDKSLLWINAGIVPLKPFFLDLKTPPSNKLVSIQRCIRVNDLDKVGYSSRHLSLFEMLGFFSIGGYYKNFAINHGLKWLKSLGINEKNLYITIHPKDEESLKTLKDISFNKKRIILLESNFWDIGNGPCGYCLEIFYDRGKEFDNVNLEAIYKEKDNNRFVEIMNIVFSTFNNVDGKYLELKIKKIDMGAGFERLLTILSNVKTPYETDLFIDSLSILKQIAPTNVKNESLYIILDHLRSVYSMMNVNIFSGPKYQNYIVRTLLKRIAIQLFFTNTKNVLTSLNILIQNLIKTYIGWIKNIENNHNYIIEQIKNELASFFNIFKMHKKLVLDLVLKNTEDNIDASKIFFLYETKGIDIEIINYVLKQHNKKYSKSEFLKLFNEHKKISHNVKITSGYNESSLKSSFTNTKFIGYHLSSLNVNAIIRDIVNVQNNIWLVFDKTTFYPESGGQIYDIGKMIFNNKTFNIINVKRKNNTIFHLLEPNKDIKILKINKRVKLIVNKERRKKITLNHSATHLLHFHLRKLLGNDVLQAGSSKNEFRLRFDFTSFNKFNKIDLIKKLEKEVKKDIINNYITKYRNFTLNEAKKENFLLTFLNEYSKLDQLRGVVIGPSKELCGGTHVKSSKEIKDFVIKNCKKKGSHTYRIEALTHDCATKFKIEQLNKKVLKTQKNLPILKEKDLNRVYVKNPIINFFKIEKQLPIGILLNYYDKNFNKKEITIFIYGDKLNAILICSNNSNFNIIIQKLKNKNLIKGGGTNKIFMGALLTNISTFLKILENLGL